MEKDGEEIQTVREAITAAMEKHEEKEVEEVKEEVKAEEPEKEEVKEPPKEEEKQEEKPESGDSEAESVETEDAPEAAEVKEDKKPPQALSAHLKGKWSDLPEEVKNEFIRLEHASAKGVQTLKADAQAGRSLMAEIRPYEGLIQSAGGTPETVVRNLLQTAAILRTGTTQQKQGAVLSIMQEYGIQLNGQAPAQVDPYMQEIQELRKQLEQQQQSRTQQEESVVLNTIESFLGETDDKGNPKYPLDDNLEVELVDEIASVRRKNPSKTDRQVLEQAYENVSWKVPEIRQTLIARQAADAEAKRKEKSAQEIAKKQNAGVSIKGTSATAANQKDIPLRDLIASQVYGTDKRI
jgi:hypothetical protein